MAAIKTPLKPEMRSRYVSVRRTAQSIILTFQPADELTFGLAHRAKEARRRVAKLIRRTKSLTLNSREGRIFATFNRTSLKSVAVLLAAIDVELDKLKTERLHPALVEELLRITARERIRWTKDGRLRSSGHGSFKRGRQTISFPLYPPSEIAHLADEPETILRWRNEDAAPSREPPQLTAP